MTMTIRQQSMTGTGEKDYTLEEYVEMFSWHSKQLFHVLDAKDSDFQKDWQEMMDYDKKIKNLAMKRFVSIYTKQNS